MKINKCLWVFSWGHFWLQSPEPLGSMAFNYNENSQGAQGPGYLCWATGAHSGIRLGLSFPEYLRSGLFLVPFYYSCERLDFSWAPLIFEERKAFIWTATSVLNQAHWYPRPNSHSFKSAGFNQFVATHPPDLMLDFHSFFRFLVPSWSDTHLYLLWSIILSLCFSWPAPYLFQISICK